MKSVEVQTDSFPTRLLFCFFLLVSLVALSGCVTGMGGRVHTTVTTFHNLPTNGISSGTFVVIGDTNLMNSVENDFYLQLVRSELVARGLRAATSVDEIDWFVDVEYASLPPLKFSGSTPIIGQTGGGTVQHYGTVTAPSGSAFYSGTSYSSPQYGVVGFRPTENYYFGWRLVVYVWDRDGFLRDGPTKTRLEAKVTASGRNGSLPQVMPIMVKELFREFPGRSGIPRENNVPLSR